MPERTITIPRIPLSLNRQERMHWSKWHKEKKEWIHDIFFLVKEHGNALPHLVDHITITKIIVYFDKIRNRDESNFEPIIIKPLLDALVYAKIIADDTAKYVTRPGRVEFELDRDSPRTEVTLEWKQ